MRPMKPRPVGSIFEALVLAMGEIGEKAGRPAQGVEVAADFLGVTRFTLTHQTDPDDTKHTMDVRALGLLAQHFRLHALAHYFAAAAGGSFIPLPALGSDGKWAELTSEAVEDMGRLAAEIVRDLAHGKLDAREAQRCLGLEAEIMRHMSNLYAMTLAAAEGRQ